MNRKPSRKEAKYTTPDHRPMIPALRQPIDTMDLAIREKCREDQLISPKDFLNWR